MYFYTRRSIVMDHGLGIPWEWNSHSLLMGILSFLQTCSFSLHKTTGESGLLLSDTFISCLDSLSGGSDEETNSSWVAWLKF